MQPEWDVPTVLIKSPGLQLVIDWASSIENWNQLRSSALCAPADMLLFVGQIISNFNAEEVRRQMIEITKPYFLLRYDKNCVNYCILKFKKKGKENLCDVRGAACMSDASWGGYIRISNRTPGSSGLLLQDSMKPSKN